MLAITTKTKIKLIGSDVARLTLEDNNVYRVTHCMSNTRSALGNESDYLEFDLSYGEALNVLIEGYPSWVTVSDLPNLSPDKQVQFATALFDAGLLMKK
mmetsp:Transcript_40888/g.79624  ORF Transcript_40888/g.79624 Transcript_40888/m.79624 type:complete len:99 (-) Transcript_40888:83-379(-)